MENEKVSVIIPAYNSEKTIGRAVGSVLAQTYGNIETVIIDDGSEDSTPEIADRLCSEHEGIIVIHKKNAGVSAARNDGIRACTGEWFITLDADDYIDSTMIEKMYKDVSEGGADLSICGFRRVFDDGKVELRRADEDFQGTKEEFLNLMFLELFDKQLIHTHSNKIYRTATVRENNLYYDERMSINEDICFSLRYIRHCKEIAVRRETWLNYVQHDRGESLVTKFNVNGLDTCFDVLKAYNELFDECEVDDYVINSMNNRMLFHICGFAGMPYYMTDWSDEKKLDMIRKLCERKEFRELIDQTTPVGMKNRTARFLFKHHMPEAYHRLCKLLYSSALYEERGKGSREKFPEETEDTYTENTDASGTYAEETFDGPDSIPDLCSSEEVIAAEEERGSEDEILPEESREHEACEDEIGGPEACATETGEAEIPESEISEIQDSQDPEEEAAGIDISEAEREESEDDSAFINKILPENIERILSESLKEDRDIREDENFAEGDRDNEGMTYECDRSDEEEIRVHSDEAEIYVEKVEIKKGTAGMHRRTRHHAVSARINHHDADESESRHSASVRINHHSAAESEGITRIRRRTGTHRPGHVSHMDRYESIKQPEAGSYPDTNAKKAGAGKDDEYRQIELSDLFDMS